MSKEYVNRLRYLNYASIYSTTGDSEHSLGREVCFGSTLNRGYVLHDMHYEIILIRDPKYVLTRNLSNLCFLTKKEVKRHVLIAKRLFPFTYSVEECTYEDYEAFKVTIDLSANHFYHRYITTWVRYLYEFPYNVLFNDVLRLKHSYLKKESIANLYVLCVNSYNGCAGEGYGTGHSMPYKNSNFLKEQQLKAAIEKYGRIQDRYSGRLNNLYPSINGIRFKGICSTEDDLNRSHYLEYWLDQEEFEKRAQVYLANYKLMIQK